MILAGKKTSTRRLWKTPHASVGKVHRIRETLFGPSQGRILIKEVHKEKLLDITEEEAQAEGGYTRQQFLKVWFEINPESERNPEVYVIKFAKDWRYLFEPALYER